jgi:Tfp pilus assembly protein PilO
MDKKKKELAAMAAVFAVLGVVVIYQLMPGSASQPGAKEPGARTDYRERLMRAEHMVKLLPQQKIVGEELHKKLDSYKSQIPLESDHTWLSRRINSISRETGVQDVSQKFRSADTSGRELAPELQGAYVEKVWEIHMRCSYHELGRFLSALEGSAKFLEIMDIGIEGDGTDQQKIMLLICYIAKKG